MRIGFGYDVHALVKGRKLIIGGVNIPYDRGLSGHSDADVLCHAIGDALLGAAGFADLGHHFPSTDNKFKNISSLILLSNIHRLLSRANFIIINIDSTIVIEQPKISLFTSQMKLNIARNLAIQPDQISIKATTSEGLGFVGTGDGIAAYAICLLESYGS